MLASVAVARVVDSPLTMVPGLFLYGVEYAHVAAAAVSLALHN